MKIFNRALSGRIGFGLLAAFCLALFSANGSAQTCASLTAGNLTYTQNFDTLANTGTSSTVPTGFGFVESGTGANATYTAGTGSATTGDTYSLGAAGSGERAFGGLQTNAFNPTIGACFVNNTGGAIGSFTVTYDGEQYRLGTNTAGRPQDRLDFQYSVDPNATLTTGTYVDVNALDFSSPVTMGTVGALDGNAAANRTAGITSGVPSLNIPVGATFYIRFLDFNVTGADDILAIDNFSITVSALTAAGASLAGRVVNSGGKGIMNARLTLSGGSLAEPISVSTDRAGFYRFADVPAGETYVLTVAARRYTFSESSRVVNLNDNLTNVDFVGEQSGLNTLQP